MSTDLSPHLIEALQDAEKTCENVQEFLERGEVVPSLDLWKAVGRLSHASSSLWHLIGTVRAQASHDASKEANGKNL